jgi:hypothetical protein
MKKLFLLSILLLSLTQYSGVINARKITIKNCSDAENITCTADMEVLTWQGNEHTTDSKTLGKKNSTITFEDDGFFKLINQIKCGSGHAIENLSADIEKDRYYVFKKIPEGGVYQGQFETGKKCN